MLTRDMIILFSRISLTFFLSVPLYTFAESREFLIGDSPELQLGNLSGSIELKAGESDRILINYELYGEGINVNFDQSGDQIVVVVDQDGGHDESHVDFDIEVPASGRYTIKSGSGSIVASGVGGKLIFHTVEGKIDLTNSSGDIELVSFTGPVTLSEVQDADLDVSTVSNSITYQNGSLSGESYKFHTVSGSISIDHTADAAYRINGGSISGSIQNKAGDGIEIIKQKNWPFNTISGNYNNGIVDLNVKTVSGSIRIDIK